MSDFNSNGYFSSGTAYDFAANTANTLSFTQTTTSNVANTFERTLINFAANSSGDALRIVKRPTIGQLYPRYLR